MDLKTIFPVRFRSGLNNLLQGNGLEEIRIRIGQAIEFLFHDGSKYYRIAEENCRINAEDISEMLNYISHYSLYAYREKIRQGFVTIEGGHRIGLAGSVVMERGEITGISPVTFLNIRVAHERRGCAEGILPWICRENGIYHTLLFSEPGIGKTTYLRDLIRLLSLGNGKTAGMKIGVVDERSELAACDRGIPQNDLGPRTDVLDGCAKPAGMTLLLRVMSPQVIAVDELGKKEDFAAVEEAAVSGCRVLATLHAGSLKELREKQNLDNRLKQGLFERYVGLYRNKGGERRFRIYDGSMDRLC